MIGASLRFAGDVGACAKVVIEADGMQALDTPVSRVEILGMPIAAELMEILRCPESHDVLVFVSQDSRDYLFCPTSKLRYRVLDGIPVMLVDDAERLDDDACSALMALVEK